MTDDEIKALLALADTAKTYYSAESVSDPVSECLEALPALAREVLAARETIARQDIEIKLLRAELSLRSALEGK